MRKNKGLSLLDFFYLNQKTDHVSTELKSLFKNHGSLQRNIALHLRLINFTLPKLYDELKPIKGYSRPFDLLIKKIQELEKRIDLYISLMIESGIDLPSDIRGYIRLSDILPLIQPGKDKDDVDSNLEKENKGLNHILNIAYNKIKQLKKKQNFKMGNLTDSEIEMIADDTRKHNEKINYSAMGRVLGVSYETVRREIKKRSLNYLIDPPQ